MLFRSSEFTSKERKVYEQILAFQEPLRDISEFREAAKDLIDLIDGAMLKNPQPIIKANITIQLKLLEVLFLEEDFINSIGELKNPQQKNALLKSGQDLYQAVNKEKTKLFSLDNDDISRAVNKLEDVADAFGAGLEEADAKSRTAGDFMLPADATEEEREKIGRAHV